MIARATASVLSAVLLAGFVVNTAAQHQVGLGGYYLGQPMQACPDNRPPVASPNFPRTTCELPIVLTLAEQPVSSLWVAFAEDHVFLILAHLSSSGEAGRAKVLQSLSRQFGSPEGPTKTFGRERYVWKLSGGRQVALEGDAVATTVAFVEQDFYERVTGSQMAASHLPEGFRIVNHAPPYLMIVVPKGTPEQDLKSFVYALRDARRSNGLAKLIPATTPAGALGPYSTVAVMIFDDAKYASLQHHERWVNADPSDPFVAEYNARLRAQYLYSAATGKERGDISTPAGAWKLF